MPQSTTEGFWIFEQNLLPTLLILSHIVGYAFDEDEFTAIEYGLTGTSDEKNIWWTYQFIGDKTIDIRFARDEDNKDIIFIDLLFDKDLVGQVGLTIYIAQDFNLQSIHYSKPRS